MKIAYLSYWGVHDGLTKATVLPNIDILSSFEKVSKIMFFTIERSDFKKYNTENPKIQHIPLESRLNSIRILNKISDFIRFPNLIKKIILANDIDVLICRGAPAGAIGLLTLKKVSIPLIVESFEPHADYMLESGVWSKFSVSYLLEKNWENEMKKKALAVLPVSLNYKNKLIEEGINAEIHLVACAVDSSKFHFDEEDRESIRKMLHIGKDKLVGIYVGKFGDIYLKNEFFDILKAIKNQLEERFYFIILSPQNKDEILTLMRNNQLDDDSIEIRKVDHEDVPNYLSAADFGLSTVRPSPHRKYCSPIKTGEYWANGLPVFITENIGDDSEIIRELNVGAIINLNAIRESVKSFIALLLKKKRSDWANEIMPLAKKYRSFEDVKAAYQKILIQIEKG